MNRFASAIGSAALILMVLFLAPAGTRSEDTVHVVTRCGFTNFTSDWPVVEEFEAIGGANCPTCEYYKHGFYRVYLAKGDCTKGDLLIDGGYRNNLRDGRWTYGNSFETFENGLLHGPRETRGSDGKLYFQGSYHKGSADGVHTWWYESGNKEEEWSYSRGFYNGPHRVWYDAPGGQLQEETWWAGDKEHGLSTGWWENGRMQFQGTYYHGLVVGSHKGWYESGAPAYEWFFSSDGQACGTWRSYPTYGAPYETDYGSCTGYEVTKEPYPDPEKVPAELRGHVRDRETGAPVHGAAVQAGAVQSLTNVEGFYALQFAEQRQVTVNISKEGYYTRTATFDLTGYEYRTANCALKPVKVTEKPAVTEIKSQYGNFFLENLTVNNTYTVSVDWGGADPGAIRFSANGNTFTVQASAGGGSRAFNMGADFKTGLSGTTNTLSITAVNAEGVESDPELLHPVVAPVPSWTSDLGTFGKIAPDKGFLKYSLSAQWPKEPLRIRVDEETLGSTLWKLWAFMPFIGGRAFGIPPTRVFLDVEAKTDGSGSVACGGSTGFEAAGQQVAGKLGGRGNLEYQIGKGFSWKGADVIMGMDGTIKKEVGPVTLIPALEGAVSLPVVGRPIKWLNETAKIEGKVKIGGDVELSVIDDKGALGFRKSEGNIIDEISLGTSLAMMGLKAEVTGGGDAKLNWQFPAAPGYLKKLDAKFHAKMVLTAWLFNREFEKEHTFSYPEGISPASLAVNDSDKGAFLPLSRDYLLAAPYSKFLPVTGRMPMTETDPEGEVLLVENIYPYSEPALAERNGKMAAAFVYSDPADPVTRSTEIHFTYHDGTSFSVPAAVMDDTRAEFAPAIAFDQSGRVIAAWERVKVEDFTPSADDRALEEMVPLLEIVYAVFDPQTGGWSPPEALTDNGYLDHAPMLAQAPDGSVMLAWRSNEGNELLGSDLHPTKVHYAFWNGESFSPPNTIDTAFADCPQFAVAYNGAEAMLVFVKDMDGDLSTPDDLEIFYRRWDGGTWTTTVRLTDNQAADISPRTTYRADGSLELLWINGQDLVQLTDLALGEYRTVRPGAGTQSSFIDYSLLMDSANRLVVLWQGVDANGSDLFYRFYDRDTDTWTADLRLTRNPAMEIQPAAVFSSTGLLMALYARDDFQTGLRNLYFTSHLFSKDAQVNDGSLSVEPVNPEPGTEATLFCQVQNAGDLPLRDLQVAFYLGDPEDSGQLLGSAVVSPSPLEGGSTGIASIPWTVPVEADSYRIYAIVDPDDAIEESNENNNLASFTSLLPDLEAVQCYPLQNPDGTITLTAVVENIGPIAARQVAVMFRANGVDMGYRTIPAVLSGLRAEVSHTWIPETDFTGLLLDFETAVDPENLIPEIREDNNTAGAPFFLADASISTLDFRGVAMGADASVRVFTFTNTGTQPISLGQIALIGAGGTGFSIGSKPDPGETLGANESCTVEVAFNPVAPGRYEAQLQILRADGTTAFVVPLFALALNRGDIDGNGTVDLADAVIALGIVSGIAHGEIYLAADLNSDGRIDIMEAIQILARIAEITQAP